MNKAWLIVALLCSACGGEDDSAFTCADGDRSGTYLMHYVERDGGNCGAFPDTVTRFDGSGTLADGCKLTAPDTVSEDGCKLERSLSCTQDGFKVDGVGTTTQTSEDGSTIEGVLTMTIRDAATGDLVCISTYDQTATRQ